MRAPQTMQSRLEQIAGISAMVFLVLGCFWVIKPFLSAIVWSAILCYCTWPIYSRLEKMFSGRNTLAATVMTVLIVLIIIIPLFVISINLVKSSTVLIPLMKQWIKGGAPEAPSWVTDIPTVGSWIQSYWNDMAHDSERMIDTLRELLTEWKGWLLQRSLDIGNAFIQLVLSVFISFFIYRDGPSVLENLVSMEHRLAGTRTYRLLDVIGGTVKGVVYGILGTAVAQGTLAGIGFWIAGVHFPFWLGTLTFFLSLILPAGPPMVWIPCAIWLFMKDRNGWGVFMLLWGFLVVSGVDNILKPYLISRGANLPFVLVFLGVLGGVLAFGLIGIFVGPTLMAVGYVLLKEWNTKRVHEG